MIYVLCDVTGPIKPLIVEALKKGFNDTIPETMINCIGTTLPVKAYDSPYDVKHYDDAERFLAECGKYSYKEAGEEGMFGVNEIQLEACVDKGLTHFVICEDVDVIKRIMSDHRHKKDKDGNECPFMLLNIDYGNEHSLLTTICPRFGITDIEKVQEKKNKVDWTLKSLILDKGFHGLKHQEIEVHNKGTEDWDELVELTWSALKPIVSDNSKYYYWGLLLNTKRLFAENPDDAQDTEGFEFTEDYWKVVSSAVYRRLQDKAQVFPLEKRDYPHTRMTHSEECASIAEKLGEYVIDTIKRYSNEHADIPYNSMCSKIPILLRAAALLHDMGNPPFGHFGEECIKDWFAKAFTEQEVMKHPELRELNQIGNLMDDLKNDFIHYEGNAQLFRLLTSLDKVDKRFNFTYALLATIMKYPVSSVDFDPKIPEKKKPGYFFAEKEFFKMLKNEMRLKGRHPLTYLLEAADDISYLTADLGDAYKRGLVSIDNIKKAFADNDCSEIIGKIDDFVAEYDFDTERENYVHAMDLLHNYLKNVLTSEVAIAFETHYRELMSGEFDTDLISVCKRGNKLSIAIRYLLEKYVYDCLDIAQAQVKAAKIMEELMNVYIHSALSIGEQKRPSLHGRVILTFSQNYCQAYKDNLTIKGNNRLRKYYQLLLALDNLCGMTDSYAETMYRMISSH
ncbi:MAG: dNTP triphosphohydrolase [Methanomassiliicoccaceae archaeon]|nr:dNTP triphosphohydrolase [Methanomassiliicoccaceae archaeon]